MALDACERQQMKIAELAPRTIEALREMSPSWLDIGNPIDIWPAVSKLGLPFGETLKKGLRLLLADPGVDAALLITGAWLEGSSYPLSRVIQEVTAEFGDKPLVCSLFEGWISSTRVADVEEKLGEDRNVVFLPSLDRAVSALSRLAEYSEFCQREE